MYSSVIRRSVASCSVVSEVRSACHWRRTASNNAAAPPVPAATDRPVLIASMRRPGRVSALAVFASSSSSQIASTPTVITAATATATTLHAIGRSGAARYTGSCRLLPRLVRHHRTTTVIAAARTISAGHHPASTPAKALMA